MPPSRRRADTVLVIFDCDGVLVDSERWSIATLRDLLTEQGAALTTEETIHHFLGVSIPVCLERCAQLLGGTLPEGFFDTLVDRTRRAFEAGLTSMPGIEGVLDALSAPYCVASNGNHLKVNFTLGHTGLLPRFTGRIFTADDVARPKPAPDLFLHAARSLGGTPETAVVVEDTPTGIRAAKAAGMHAIGFCAMTPALRLQEAGADALAPTMDELLRCLQARGAV